MKHKQKLTLARKLRTQDELKKRVSVFQTEAWNKRKSDIAASVKNREIVAKAKAKERKLKVKTKKKV